MKPGEYFNAPWWLRIVVFLGSALLLNGCGTFQSPLVSSDLVIFKNFNKYKLRVIVDTSDIDNYVPFIGDQEILNYLDSHCLYTKFKLVVASKDFFPRLFEEVDFINMSETSNAPSENYDVLIKMSPDDSYIDTKGAPNHVEVQLDINMKVLRNDGKVLLDEIIYSTGISSLGTRMTIGGKTLAAKRAWSFIGAKKNASRGIFIKIGEILNQHTNPIDEHIEYVASLKKMEMEKQARPPALTGKFIYNDKTSILPNNTIDAGEQSTIKATITNSGKGTAFDVNLITESSYKNINFPETIPIGDIQPGESKDVTIPINADLSLASGTASFLINAREKKGV